MLYYNTKSTKRLRLTIIFTLLLVSCANLRGKERKLPAFQKRNDALNLTYSELLTTLDYPTFALLYENNWPLAFYVYQKGCHFVSEIEPVLFDYLRTTNLLLFTFDYSESDFGLLQQNYQDTLNFKGTPAFYFWQKDSFNASITGITEIKSLRMMTKTFANLLEYYATKVDFSDHELNSTPNSLTVSLDLKDETAVNFVGNEVFPLIKQENSLLIKLHDQTLLSFYFSDTKETFVYSNETSIEIIERIRLYYL
ncbi:MAG TPA: hypothetical protein VFD05_01910 [Bacilli bacterium]|nr:hypothetical protein [Bacilli bacterium]